MELSKEVFAASVSLRKKPKNLELKDTYLFENAFSTEIKGTYFFNLFDVHILDGAIASFKRFKFYKSLSYILPLSISKVFKKILLLGRAQSRIEAGVWITDEWSSEYFHWLTDALPRLIVAEMNAEIRTVVLPQSYHTKLYVQESLALLNFNAHYYHKRVKVRQLGVSTHTAPTGNYNELIINQLRDRFLSDKASVAFRKIYISRQKANKRKVLNEDLVIELLLAHNYEIHFFEDYDFKKQLEIMIQTKVVMGLHGAGLTNMLFMQAGGTILELRNGNDAHNNCFYSLASALNHDYYYLISDGNTSNTHTVDVTVNINKLEEVFQLMECN